MGRERRCVLAMLLRAHGLSNLVNERRQKWPLVGMGDFQLSDMLMFREHRQVQMVRRIVKSKDVPTVSVNEMKAVRGPERVAARHVNGHRCMEPMPGRILETESEASRDVVAEEVVQLDSRGANEHPQYR